MATVGAYQQLPFILGDIKGAAPVAGTRRHGCTRRMRGQVGKVNVVTEGNRHIGYHLPFDRPLHVGLHLLHGFGQG